MSEVRFRNDFVVKLNPRATVGSDAGLAYAAWVTDPDVADDRDTTLGRARVLAPCTRGGHNTVFEHGSMSVYLRVPGVVLWQLTRQRFMSLDAEDLSFNIESGRYRVLEPEFYLPPPGRPTAEPPGFRPMRPELDSDTATHSYAVATGEGVCRDAWARYTAALEVGVAREIARLYLPNWAIYCSAYVTAKPLSWLQFFSKRNKTPDTEVATFPQWEIEQVAARCEQLFVNLWPQAHAQFLLNGRRAP
jgi:thymidylate synthase (FAD)